MGGDAQQETRDKHLKNYLASEFSGTDVFLFQEIIDVNRLVNNVVPRDMNCLSYNSQNEKHQYVVICITSKYKFYKEPGDRDNVIDEVSIDGLNKSRPAVHTLVKNSKGEVILRLVGVHLKAFPSEYATRLKQVDAIAEFLKPLEKRAVPTVVAGDFNTFDAKSTGQRADDNVMISNVFRQKKVNLVESPNIYDYTFRSPSHRNKLDRFWLSKNIKTVRPPKVHGPCNDIRSGKGSLADPQYFYNNISDHCPVSVTIQL